MYKVQKKYIAYAVPIFVTFLICLWGGIYDFTFALYGAAVFGGLWHISRRRRLFIPRNITTYGMGILLFGFVISAFIARDKGMAFIGVLRGAMLIGFWIFWNNLERPNRRKMVDDIPDIAAFLTVMTLILYFVPPVRDYLYQADRMGGVFQYSNTYALFLLISIVILFYRQDRQGIRNEACRKYIEMCVLVCGIVFCGSRSVMVLSVITVSALLITERMDRKRWLVALGIAILICFGLQLILKLDIQRLLKLTMDSSTLNGRFLYWRDALPVVCRNPLGLGYMGYYFLQTQFQTGNYVTKFVHNDILQFGLDAGVIAAAALVMILIANIINRNNTKQNRIILTLIFLHSLFDFSLQYTVMFCIMLMCMDGWKEKKQEWKGRGAGIIVGISVGIFLYFSAALGCAHFDRYEIGLAMYPGNTLARESRMREEGNGEDAEQIIEKNGMLADAYECAAAQHLKKKEYMGAYEDIQGMLNNAGYRLEYYNRAVYDLSIALDQAIKAQDYDGAQAILETIQGVPELLTELKAKTSSLAYRINDKPVFELDEEIQKYIENVSGISLL